MKNITSEWFFLWRFQHDFSMVSKKYIFLFYLFLDSDTNLRQKKRKKRIKINPSGRVHTKNNKL